MSEVPERDARMAKVEALRAAGVDPYPVRFDRTATAGELHDRYDSLADGEETDAVVRVAGRVLLRRQMGKLVFLTLRDGSGSVQLFVSRAVVGDVPGVAAGRGGDDQAETRWWDLVGPSPHHLG